MQQLHISRDILDEKRNMFTEIRMPWQWWQYKETGQVISQTWLSMLKGKGQTRAELYINDSRPPNHNFIVGSINHPRFMDDFRFNLWACQSHISKFNMVWNIRWSLIAILGSPPDPVADIGLPPLGRVGQVGELGPGVAWDCWGPET